MSEQLKNFMGGRSNIHPVNIARHLPDHTKAELVTIFESDKRHSAKMLLVLCTVRDESWKLTIKDDEIIDPVSLVQGKSGTEIDVVAKIFGELYIAKDLRDMNTRDAFEYAKKWKKQLTAVAYNTLSAKVRVDSSGIDMQEVSEFLRVHQNPFIYTSSNVDTQKEAAKFRAFLKTIQNS